MPRKPTASAYPGEGDGRPNVGDKARPGITPSNRGKPTKSYGPWYGIADGRPDPGDNALGANSPIPRSGGTRSSSVKRGSE